MSLFRHERVISNLEHLGAYIDTENGNARGCFSTLEVDEDDNGGQQEIGFNGHYLRRSDKNSGEQCIVFSSGQSESRPPFEVVITEDSAFAVGAIQVYSRSKITV
jgi:hypothetical protein